jgi:hypothetical protein
MSEGATVRSTVDRGIAAAHAVDETQCIIGVSDGLHPTGEFAGASFPTVIDMALPVDMEKVCDEETSTPWLWLPQDGIWPHANPCRGSAMKSSQKSKVRSRKFTSAVYVPGPKNTSFRDIFGNSDYQRKYDSGLGPCVLLVSPTTSESCLFLFSS